MSRKSRSKKVSSVNIVDTPQFNESEILSTIQQMRNNDAKLQKIKNEWARFKKSIAK